MSAQPAASLDGPCRRSFAEAAPDAALQRAAAGLRERGFSVAFADTAADARASLVDKLPTDKLILTARSETLRLSGLAADIDESGRFQSIRARLKALDRGSLEARQLRAAPDLVVGSVHAVTEEGTVVTVSTTGSQLGPYASGAAQQLWLVGAQKIVPDLDAALLRVRTYSLPLETERVAAQGQSSRIAKTLIVEHETQDRTTVVLIRETIGF